MSLPKKQRGALHIGCQQLADILIENNVPLNAFIKNIEVRPTMHSIKDIIKSMARSKFGKESTEQLTTPELNEIWDELRLSLGQLTGEDIPFPSEELSDNYLQSYEKR